MAMSVRIKVTYNDDSQQDFEFGRGDSEIAIDFFEMRRSRNQKKSVVAIDLSELEECTNLQKLEFRSSRIKSIDLSPLSSCEDLIELSLPGNRLRTINLKPLSSCKKLKGITLWWNRLRRINLKPLSSCTNLRSLSLDDNFISSIDLFPLASCHALHSLGLTCNPIQSLDVTPLALNPSFKTLSWGKRVAGTGDPCRREVSTEVTAWCRTPFPGRRFELWNQKASLNPLAAVESWEFLHKIASMSHALSIPAQSYVLNALGFDAYGLIDDDISEFLISISPETSIEEAREKVRPVVVEKICQQIDNGGTTIGIDVDVLASDVVEIAQRFEQITKLRTSEMMNLVILKEAPRKRIWYNVFQLALTAYGFLILKDIEMDRIGAYFSGGLLIKVYEEALARIQHAIQEIGFDAHIQEAESVDPLNPISFEPKNMSRQMMYYVLGIAGATRP
jgi:hypothetical protein